MTWLADYSWMWVPLYIVRLTIAILITGMTIRFLLFVTSNTIKGMREEWRDAAKRAAKRPPPPPPNRVIKRG